jgi:hypothetical protein
MIWALEIKLARRDCSEIFIGCSELPSVNADEISSILKEVC